VYAKTRIGLINVVQHNMWRDLKQHRVLLLFERTALIEQIEQQVSGNQRPALNQTAYS